MFNTLLKSLFHVASQNRLLARLASRYGMATPASFARRFVAGEELEEAIKVARDIAARGMTLTLDHLGESVTSIAEAEKATSTYLTMLDQVVAAGIERNISVKLTQLGLNVDRATCTDNLRRLLNAGARREFFVRFDMENSAFTQVTLDIFETLWKQGYRNVGVALQAALHRSEQDLHRMNALGARVRLVKGAYKEPRTIAYRKKRDVDAAYLRMMQTLLREGTYPAVATHDPVLLASAKRYAAEHGIGPDRFEFQMLYGIRRDLQAALVAEGFRVRLYVPFGRDWFPYFMRRLGERPANLLFVVRSLLREA
jgi:proline dehydrogenase